MTRRYAWLWVAVALGLPVADPPTARALPNPGPLRFIAPTPTQLTTVTTTSVSLRLDAACSFDPGTLASVTLAGMPVPAALFLPFSACTSNRITSQTAVVSIALPDGTITSGPLSLTAGVAGSFAGTGTGTGLSWNFDGGAPPATGSPASATFQAAGVFTVRLRATRSQMLAASGLDAGNLVTAQASFQAGDPTPAVRAVEVIVPPNVDFANFESGHVRPLALAPNGAHLYAVNTPDNRLEVFAVGDGSLTRVGDVAVGLEPVAVAARSNTEVWVVNHLSDSVSVVDTSDPAHPRLTATLNVGDEPRDIVFGRADRSRAFITAAHRGQNRPGGPDLIAEGTPRSDVWVFNATNLAVAPTILAFFGDTPRALTVTPNGATVYVAAFHSGNQTTTINQPVVTANGGVPPFPVSSTPGEPDTGLIVKFNPANLRWEDERGLAGPNWASRVPFSLPDQDVFLINAEAEPPAPAAAPNFAVGVGTIIFNMAVRPGPSGGRLFVSNLESRNHVRFEPLINANLGVQGHIAESRITVVQGTTPDPVHLNPHIDYGVPTGDAGEIAESLAFPMDMVFSSDGTTLWVAAFGSGKVAAIDAAALEGGTPTRATLDVGGGPSGLALDEARDQLYVMNRFDHAIRIVTDASNPALRALGATVPLRFDPSPKAAKQGRRFLYDARTTSGHGDSACASCHVFGDFDSLAWDLGDPFGAVVPNPNPFRLGGFGSDFHPLKGPMTTQSLRGMADAGPMHWRGDRSGATDGGNALDEDAAFKEFNPAFVGLLGRSAQLSASEMQQFTDFILTVRYPPNPIRALNDVGNAGQDSGEAFFSNQTTDGGNTCQFCHRLPLGTDGFSSFEGETQEFKIPHTRNLYQKVGMFGVPNGLPGIPATGNLGPQVRGFGMLHDGSIATVFDFVNADVFANLTPGLRRDLESFSVAFDTGLRPVVGQQVTVTAATKANGFLAIRIGVFVGQAEAAGCDLVVRGVVGGTPRSWLYDTGTNLLVPDVLGEPGVAEATLRGSLAGSDVLTYTAAPPGTGERAGLDRDRDTWPDGSEAAFQTDPADPRSNPWRFVP